MADSVMNYLDVKALCSAIRERYGQNVIIDLGDYEVMPNNTVRTKNGPSREDLKGSILRFHQVEDVAKVLLLEDRIEDTWAHVRRSSAEALGVALMEAGLLEFGELKTIKGGPIFPGDTTTFETSLWVVRPGVVWTHKKELEAARWEARDAAIREIHAAGLRLQRKGDYGPIMGRALVDQAATMRMK